MASTSETMTLPELKTALRRAGLSQVGNKRTLIERLTAHGIDVTAPPIPVHPNAAFAYAPGEIYVTEISERDSIRILFLRVDSRTESNNIRFWALKSIRGAPVDAEHWRVTPDVESGSRRLLGMPTKRDGWCVTWDEIRCSIKELYDPEKTYIDFVYTRNLDM